MYYFTMEITFHIPEFARMERNLHCDIVYIITVWIVLDHVIAVIKTWRLKAYDAKVLKSV